METLSDEKLMSAAPWLQVLLPAQSCSGSDASVDPQLLKMALAPHPKLKAALFPAAPRGHGLTADISLYHLLQVSQPPLAVSCDLAASCLHFPFFPPPVSAPAGLLQTIWLAGRKHTKLHW